MMHLIHQYMFQLKDLLQNIRNKQFAVLIIHGVQFGWIGSVDSCPGQNIDYHHASNWQALIGIVILNPDKLWAQLWGLFYKHILFGFRSG